MSGQGQVNYLTCPAKSSPMLYVHPWGVISTQLLALLDNSQARKEAGESSRAGKRRFPTLLPAPRCPLTRRRVSKMPPSPPEFLFTPVNEPSCLPINYYYKLLCVDIGVHIHVECTQAHTCTCMHVCVVIEFSFSPLSPVLQAASDEKPLSLPVRLIASWGPHSWRGRDPVCCADGRSTKMGWSCPGLRPPLHF